MSAAVVNDPTFTALDRCDRCGAYASVRIELPSGGELLLCAHHVREHSAKLREDGGRIVAERDVPA